MARKTTKERLRAAGRTQKQVARKVGVCASTVSRHLSKPGPKTGKVARIAKRGIK